MSRVSPRLRRSSQRVLHYLGARDFKCHRNNGPGLSEEVRAELSVRGAKQALATVYSCSATDLNFRKVLTPKVKPIRANAQR